MFNPNDPNIQSNLAKVKEILMNPDVEIFILPTPKLREMIFKNEHPTIKALGPNTKAVFLEGKGLKIQKIMVWRFITGTLDERHKLILSLGEIRVLENGATLIGNSDNSIVGI